MEDFDREDWFVPIFRDVAEWVGTSGAAVFGCIWFMSHWKNKRCHAALATIGAATGLDERTVRRQIRKLEAKELIECIGRESDHTPRSYVPRYVPMMMRPEAIARRKKRGDKMSALFDES